MPLQEAMCLYCEAEFAFNSPLDHSFIARKTFLFPSLSINPRYTHHAAAKTMSVSALIAHLMTLCRRACSQSSDTRDVRSGLTHRNLSINENSV